MPKTDEEKSLRVSPEDAEWTDTTIGDICQIRTTRSNPKDLPPETPYLGLGNIESDTFRILGFGTAKEVSSSVTPFEADDVLFGKLRAYLRKVTLAPHAGVCTPEILVLRPDLSKVLPIVLHGMVSSPSVIEKCVALATGTRMPRTKPQDLQSIPIRLPSLALQRRMGDLIESVDGYIKGLRNRADKALAARTTLLSNLLTPGKDRSWNERSLDELLSLEYGKALKEDNRDGKGFPVYGSAGVIGRHSSPNVSNPAVAHGPVIIVGRKGTVGAVHWSSSPCSVIDTAYYVLPRTDDSYRFLYLLLQRADLPSLSAQTGVPGLNRERVYQTVIHIPPPAEQLQIVDVMDAVDNFITDCGAATERATEVRNGLLSDLLSGRHRIPVSYDRFLSAR